MQFLHKVQLISLDICKIHRKTYRNLPSPPLSCPCPLMVALVLRGLFFMPQHKFGAIAFVKWIFFTNFA